MKEYFEIAIYGRGGQGAKTCAQIIAESSMLSDNEIQGFPEYGPERRGAPVRSFVRISKKRIRTHEPITDPDVVIVIDDGLFDLKEELRKFTCTTIINTNKDINNFKNIKSKNIILIDGSKIALKNIKINNPNIVLIGVLAKYLKKIKKEKLLKYKKIEEAITTEFLKKNKKYIIEPNLKCLKEGYDYE